MSFQYINQHLLKRKQDALLRKRNIITDADARRIVVEDKEYINFSSNDYLGFSHHSLNVDEQALGSHSSSLVTGYHAQHVALEDYLSTTLGYEAAMLFNSGFSANSSIIKALFNDKTVSNNSAVFLDKLSHASLVDGAVHAHSALVRFKHNDLNHLRSRLEKSKADNKLIVSEGVFSMDGDKAPLKELCALAKKHNAWLLIDDAHGFGVIGEHGLGSCDGLSQQELPDILVITFGKAIASSGACILGNRDFIDYMVQYNRDYIYSTAMSPLLANLTLARIKQVILATEKREKLHCNINYFKNLAHKNNIAMMPSNTAIQPIILGCPQQTLDAANSLKNKGIWVSAIRPPTVAHNTSRLRVTLTCEHSKDDIALLIKHLSSAIK
ncbi:8-amino-7-oxononanoate synthase [Pseudoalteromonas sp. MMG010]|uniref:aminotransferase class I/II-fold pyridoxal phosphate-dependent enzyme n=1 Tax=Pseudoalteromonas sp. MMG010 TaxID=2822685 RepID=UPI001B39DE31|nr:8-amino-7-oxononanoate synthase [Pseudoalteromonas sp. MMG010]MBQ4832399.1 8-amino-7-oxononanoate synthase [Pseudoalteromonas sp. MMG010]